MFKIREKILLTFLPVLLIPLIIFSVLFGIYATKLLKQGKVKGFQQASTIKAEEVIRLMRNVSNDIVSLSNNTFFENFVNAAKNKDTELIKRSRLEIEITFRTFSESKRVYDQICYIDESGREIVRINRQGDNVYVVPSGELQDTSHMNYFNETKKLDENDVYISQICLNREDGKIEVPHKPVMKYAMPVFGSEKQRRGVLVLNVMAGNLLNSIIAYTNNADIDSYLVNPEGYYLLHPEISKRWGGAIDLNTQESIKSVFSQEISSTLLSGLSGSILADKQFVNYRPISFGPLYPERHWTLIESFPASKVNSSVYTFYIVLAIFAFILIICVVITTHIFSKRLTRPINELVKGVTTIAGRGHDDLDYHIKVTSNDEMAFLTFSFNKMIYNLGTARKRLRAYADNLERKVENKTKEILERAGQQEVVAKIGNLLWTDLEIQNTMDRASVLVSKTLEVEFCEVLLLDKSQGPLHLVSGVGWNEGLVGHVTVDVGTESQSCYTLKELKPVAVRDLREEKRFPVSPILKEHGVVSGLSVPMAVGNHAVGVMGVYTKQVRGFSKDDINFLQSVGHLIAAAVARKRTEDEIIERSEQLQEVNSELEDFVYIVSHDLKEPLFAIEGISSRLYKHYKDVIDEKGNLFINRIKVNVELMAQKINEVMDVIKIGRVKYLRKNHNARAIVDDVINHLEDRITADKIDVMIQDNLPTVFCDENRLNDVFNNLVVNAIKFIGDNGKKQITIGCHENGNYYKFFVEDTGIGIRSEYQEMIFKVFRRLNDVDAEGTGVGLAIVKKIIELHNGKIWVESPLDNGKGSRFMFTIPIVKEKDK